MFTSSYPSKYLSRLTLLNFVAVAMKCNENRFPLFLLLSIKSFNVKQKAGWEEKQFWLSSFNHICNWIKSVFFYSTLGRNKSIPSRVNFLLSMIKHSRRSPLPILSLPHLQWSALLVSHSLIPCQNTKHLAQSSSLKKKPRKKPHVEL